MEKGIIERAYELAPECSTVDEVRGALRREGYSNVDGHLSGPRIRADLTKLLNMRVELITPAVMLNLFQHPWWRRTQPFSKMDPETSSG